MNHAKILLSLFLLPLAIQAADDILISGFEFDKWPDEGWTATGTAFGEGPASGSIARQREVTNFDGEKLVNSYFQGSDRAVGTLTSPPFTIQRPFINFLIGGGAWEGVTALNLVINGKVVRTASGNSQTSRDSERLDWKSWDVRDFLNKTARLQLVDQESGGWGHITVDEIRQSDRPASTDPISTIPNLETAALKTKMNDQLRKLRNSEIVKATPGTPEYDALKAEIDKRNGRTGLTPKDQERAARDLRQRLWDDPHRPSYHVIPPEGYWNDVNGALYWNGRYHLFFLGREAPEAETILSGTDSARAREVWLHASSADLLHWVWHKPALTPAFDGSMPKGVYSGGAVAGADIPTLIYHVPGQGTCIATATDPDDPTLTDWTPSPHNPVIAQPKPGENPEYIVFDPTAWREGDTYYALVGNRNRRPGYEGDSTSLFKSKDLINWEYLHPLYKSDRKWTDVAEDAACPDFFEIGDGKYMLITHVHRPFYRVQYYIGTFEDEVFTPEQHGYMTWEGGHMAGPESLLDGQGRRLMWGWVREARPLQDGWGSIASLPRVLELADDGTLLISPPVELETLRTHPRETGKISLANTETRPLEGIKGDALELEVTFAPSDQGRYGVIVRRSAEGEEQTAIVYSPEQGTLSIDVSSASLDKSARYLAYDLGYAKANNIPEEQLTVSEQIAPLVLKPGEPLTLRIFIDHSILEVFANGRQAITQRIYPTRKDSIGVALFSEGGTVAVNNVKAWTMSPTNSW